MEGEEESALGKGNSSDTRVKAVSALLGLPCQLSTAAGASEAGDESQMAGQHQPGQVL